MNRNRLFKSPAVLVFGYKGLILWGDKCTWKLKAYANDAKNQVARGSILMGERFRSEREES